MRACLLILPLLAAACSSPTGGATAEAIGPRATRDFALGGFDKIELNGSDSLTVHDGKAFAVRAEAPQGVLDRLALTVAGGTLRVGRKDNDWDWGGSGSTARITVTLPALTAAAVTGAGDMTVDKAGGDSFTGTVTGSGNLVVSALQAGTAQLSIGGSGNIDASGKVGRGDYRVTGSGDLEAGGVDADTISASTAGSGDIAARARGEAAVSIVGSGDVKVAGGAKCTVNKVGSGEATCG